MNDYFQFKQFKICQKQAAMKVGTDGVLLGAWADFQGASNILDIGTGTGLIALMAAQRNASAVIDAVEIDEDSYFQAQENVSDSAWNDRIHIYNTSIFDFYPDKLYDRIVCNPPFFINSTQTPNTGRNIARHCGEFSHPKMLDKAFQLLSENGKFCLILPPTEAMQLIEYASGVKIFTEQITEVLPNPGKQIRRYLITFTKQRVETSRKTLVLELKRHQLSDECIQLTREFYLHL